VWRTLKEERHRHLQDVRYLLQTARTDAVRPLLVLLHLLEREPQCVAEVRLAHAEHQSAHPHAVAHVFVDRVERLFCHRRNELRVENQAIYASYVFERNRKRTSKSARISDLISAASLRPEH